MRFRPVALVGLVLVTGFLLVWGCGGDDDDATTPAGSSGGVSDLLADSWMYYVAEDKTRMGPFEGTTGDAWLAFYFNDLRRAALVFDEACTPSSAPLPAREAAGFPCVGAARTHIELAELFAEAAEIQRVALRQFHQHRQEHADEVLPSDHTDYFAGVDLLHSGARGDGLARLSSYASSDSADPFLAALATWIGEGMIDGDPLVIRLWGQGSDDAVGQAGPDDLPSSDATRAYRARLDFSIAVSVGEFDRATSLLRPIEPRKPDFEEALEQREGDAPSVDATLKHHDALYLVARSRYHAALARAAAGGSDDLAILTGQAERLLGRAPSLPTSAPALADGVALVVFSGVANPKDLLDSERAQPVPAATLARLKGLVPALGLQPTADLSDLDPFIEGSNTVTLSLGEALGAASQFGAALNSEVGLAERFRGQLLRERAVQFQNSFDVRLDAVEGTDMVGAGVATRSLLEYALDKNPSNPNTELKQARISYLNDPPQLAALAHAELDTKRAGEANDYIRPLSGVYPELIAVRDSLTVLDTAWNPPNRDGSKSPVSQ